jgi:hypothetical protein
MTDLQISARGVDVVVSVLKCFADTRQDAGLIKVFNQPLDHNHRLVISDFHPACPVISVIIDIIVPDPHYAGVDYIFYDLFNRIAKLIVSECVLLEQVAVIKIAQG